ncbi:cytochrome P450 [Rhodococcus erythropolis]|nr:cytochrome P450 [Rhodococcus erythropolis]MBY6388857.1 cytochrome P450 [Rhodococcus erythropolis]
MLASTLLAAGTDTTRNQLAATVQVLCNHPDQWALLGEHPVLAPQAVEETMRHSPVVCMTMRKATEDVELGGVVIPAGTLVMANMAAANRDPAVYPDRPSRHHPPRPSSQADFRRRRALLPRYPPRQARTRRSLNRHHRPNAQPA